MKLHGRAHELEPQSAAEVREAYRCYAADVPYVHRGRALLLTHIIHRPGQPVPHFLYREADPPVTADGAQDAPQAPLRRRRPRKV